MRESDSASSSLQQSTSRRMAEVPLISQYWIDETMIEFKVNVGRNS